MKLRVGSMFAGIGGFDLGFERAGFEVAWCIEWDRNAQAVLRRRFPNAKIFGDIRKVTPDQLDRVDVICGGFPCQDLSVAGKRAGLAGKRSGLFHDAMRLVRELDPAVLVLENVPGLLSSNHGRDFGTVLREVGEGWSCDEVAWRVLDSQFFGVAQRRRRVFIVAVGHSRTGCAEEILSLATSCGGNPPPRGKTREISTSDAAEGSGGSCCERSAEVTATLVPHPFRKSKRAQSSEDDETWIDDGLANTLNGFDTGDTRTTHAIAYEISNQPTPKVGVDLIPSLDAKASGGDRLECVAFPIQDGRAIEKHQGGLGIGSNGDPSYTIDRTGSQSIAFYPTHAIAFKANGEKARSDSVLEELSPTLGSGGGNAVPRISIPMAVRRLTPVECERLQGFPDGWTDIGTDKPTADSHRYKQLGNAVTVNVAEWIARRTMKVLRGDDE